jgi:hypothetical protein
MGKNKRRDSVNFWSSLKDRRQYPRDCCGLFFLCLFHGKLKKRLPTSINLDGLASLDAATIDEQFPESAQRSQPAGLLPDTAVRSKFFRASFSSGPKFKTLMWLMSKNLFCFCFVLDAGSWPVQQARSLYHERDQRSRLGRRELL